MNTYNYLAAVYGSNAYGTCTYQDQGDCTTTSGVVGAPDTGFFFQPSFLIPTIIIGAVLIATVIFFTRKIIRHLKPQA